MVFVPLGQLIKNMDDDQLAELDMNDPFQKVKFFWEYSKRNRDEYIDSIAQDHLSLVSVTLDPKDPTLSRSVFELTVPLSLCNASENLHGGAVALIFDMCTSLTIGGASREGFWDQGHVSRSLNCQYLRPAPVGSVLLVESEVVHLGKSMGQVKGVMRMKDTGKICYGCVHDKAQVVWKDSKL